MKDSGLFIPVQSRSASFLSLDEGLNTVNHVLDKRCFGESESSLVRDIEGTIIGFCVFSMDTSDLDVEFISNGLELILVGHKLWKLDMDGGSQCSTEIGWA